MKDLWNVPFDKNRMYHSDGFGRKYFLYHFRHHDIGNFETSIYDYCESSPFDDENIGNQNLNPD